MNELIARFLDDRRSLSDDELLSRRFDEERSGFVARVKQAADGAGVVAASSEEFVHAVERRVGLAPSRSFFAQ